MPSRGAARRGQVVIETALVLLTFLAVFAGLIDLGRIFATRQALQHGVREGVRLGVTGRTIGGLDREGSIRQTVVDISRQGVDPTTVTVEHIAGGVRASGPGVADDILVVGVQHPLKVFSPWLLPLVGNTYTIHAQAAAKNEAFGS